MLKRILLPLLFLPLIVACEKKEVAAPSAPPPPVSEAPAPAAVPAATKVASGDTAKGEDIYNKTCIACHAAGVAGAPKLGDKAAWGPRIAQGNDTLYTHAIKGFQGKAGMMPSKGGNTALSDADVKAAVDYMVSKAR